MKLFAGVDAEPRATSTRIIFLFTFLTSLLVFSMYSASLTSFLAVNKINMPFEDLYGLYHTSNFEVNNIPF